MRPVRPRLVGTTEHQTSDEPWKDLVYAMGRSTDGYNVVITRWRLSPEERAQIAKGGDVFVYQYGDHPMPLLTTVGSQFHPEEPAATAKQSG